MYLLAVAVTGRCAKCSIIIVANGANNSTFRSFDARGLNIPTARVSAAITVSQLTSPVASIEPWRAQSIGESRRATKHRIPVVVTQGMSAGDRCTGRQNEEKREGFGELHRDS
jgi:hypothetical protein